MSDIILADLPEVGSNEPVVSFGQLRCRTCGAVGPWFRMGGQEEIAAWDGDHAPETGHTRYYLWSVTRQTVKVYMTGRSKRGE